MDSIHSQVNNDGRLDSEVFYRHGSDIGSFIKETDQREKIEARLGRKTIPLGPQGEDDAA